MIVLALLKTKVNLIRGNTYVSFIDSIVLYGRLSVHLRSNYPIPEQQAYNDICIYTVYVCVCAVSGDYRNQSFPVACLPLSPRII